MKVSKGEFGFKPITVLFESYEEVCSVHDALVFALNSTLDDDDYPDFDSGFTEDLIKALTKAL